MSTQIVDKNRVEVISNGGYMTPTMGFKNAGEFFAAVMNWETGAGRKDSRLQAAVNDHAEICRKAAEAKMQVNEYKAASGMNTIAGAEGGWLVPEAFATDLLKTTYDKSQVSGRAWNIPMVTEILNLPTTVETSRADGSRQGGIRAYWPSEASQYTSSKAGLGNVKLQANKLTGYTLFTEELGKFNGAALEAFLKRSFADEFAFKLDDAIVNGTGAGQPLGILNAPALITVAKEANQDADTIVAANILNMYARIPAWCLATAAWFINQDALPQILSATIGLGAAGLVSYGRYLSLLGLPVVICEQCATLGDKGDIILADMSSYLLGTDVSGMEGVVSIHMRFDYGEHAVRWILYVDGQPWQVTPFTPKNGTATQSPFITLEARA